MADTNFWSAFSTYMRELSPVVGPLCSSLGDTAAAIDRAGRGSTSLPPAQSTVLISATTVPRRRRRIKRIRTLDPST